MLHTAAQKLGELCQCDSPNWCMTSWSECLCPHSCKSSGNLHYGWTINAQVSWMCSVPSWAITCSRSPQEEVAGINTGAVRWLWKMGSNSCHQRFHEGNGNIWKSGCTICRTVWTKFPVVLHLILSFTGAMLNRHSQNFDITSMLNKSRLFCITQWECIMYSWPIFREDLYCCVLHCDNLSLDLIKLS